MAHALPQPVFTLATVDVAPDGSVDLIEAPDLTGPVTTAPPCPTGTPHDVPSPDCLCGFAVAYDLRGRQLDRYRDRLGHRMRTVAAVVLWGRLALSWGQVRGAHGAVAAFALPRDDSKERRRRAEACAARTGARIVEIDPAEPDYAPLVDHARALGAERVDATTWKALCKDRAAPRVRRSEPRHMAGDGSHVLFGFIGLAGFAAGAGLEALGAGGAVTGAACVTTWAGLGTALVPGHLRSSIVIEAEAPAPPRAPLPASRRGA